MPAKKKTAKKSKRKTTKANSKPKGLTIERVSIDLPIPDAANARTHGEKNLKVIAASLRRFGQQKPIVVDSKNVVRAGNGTLEAGKMIGWDHIDIVRSDLPPAEAQAYAIADNRSGELADWDKEVLADSLEEMDAELLDATGFSEKELEQLLAELESEGESVTSEPRESEGEALQKKWKTERGQIWRIGSHRMMCGDSTDAKDVDRLMDGKLADAVFTDPPYGVSYEAPSDKFEVIEGDDKRDDDLIDTLLLPAMRLMVKHAEDEAGFYIWHAMATREDFTIAAKMAGLIEMETIIWAKPSASLGMMDYRRDYEPCLYMAKDGCVPAFFGDRKNTAVWRVAASDIKSRSAAIGKGILILDSELGQLYVVAKPPKGKKVRRMRLGEDGTVALTSGGAESAVWEVGRDTNYRHPTQKPTDLGKRGIRNSTAPEGIVMDLFLGSGSTMAAAEETHRACYGMELDPMYCAVILERMREMGLTPELEQ